MGRNPCCSKKEEMKRGAWTSTEDELLIDYIKAHGEGKWSKISKETGLRRCGKSCRLRWLNYLRPDIKRGNITDDEEDLIIRPHKLLGNRWSLIAGRLPGRTDNEIQNYWNSYLSKKARGNQHKAPRTQKREHCIEDVFVANQTNGTKVERDGQINVAGKFESSNELPAVMWSKDESFSELMADFNSGEMVFPEFNGFDFSNFFDDFGVDDA